MPPWPEAEQTLLWWDLSPHHIAASLQVWVVQDPHGAFSQATQVNTLTLDTKLEYSGKERWNLPPHLFIFLFFLHKPAEPTKGFSLRYVALFPFRFFQPRYIPHPHNQGGYFLITLPTNSILYCNLNFPLQFCKMTQVLCEMRYRTDTNTYQDTLMSEY